MIRVWVGEAVRVKVTFTSESGDPLPATGVTITSKNPDGLVQDHEVAADPESGAFHADVPADLPGVWWVRAECVGPTAAVEEDRFEVRSSFVRS